MNITKAIVKAEIDAKLADFSNITPDELRGIFYMFLECSMFNGDIRHIRMANVDIPINFDTSGLGRSGLQYEGWAICNGNNGTTNDNGRTYIGYDPTNYPTLNAQGGEKEHTLTVPELPVLTIKEAVQDGTGDQTVPAGGTPYYKRDDRTIGSGTAHNNMQPYTVILKIQKV